MGLGAVCLLAGLEKARAPRGFFEGVRSYRLVPSVLAPALGSTLIAAELGVADAIGEPVASVHRRGFSILVEDPSDPEPAGLHLVVVCPNCIRAVPYASLAGDGSLALAECLRCDVLFDAAPDAIFATSPVRG